MSFTTVRANLPAVLRLAGEVLRQASFDSTEFVTLQRERLAALESQRTDPIALAQTALARATQAYAPGHPRYVSTIEERIANTQAVTVADAKRFWVEFYGVGAGEAAIVGDFDPGEASAALAEVFGTWKSPAAYARIPELYADKPAVTEQIETPDKANAILLAGTNLPLSESDPGYPALAIGDYIYGGSAFDSRLIVRMRQEEGLSYGAGSALEVSPEDQAGQLLVYAISAPENTGKVVTAFREVTDSAVAGGFTPEEVSKGKAGYLQQLQLARTDDSQLSGQLDRTALPRPDDAVGRHARVGHRRAHPGPGERRVPCLRESVADDRHHSRRLRQGEGPTGAAVGTSGRPAAGGALPSWRSAASFP